MDDGDHDPASISDQIEEQYVLNSLFTGGFNRETQAHLIDTLIESEPNFPQMAGANKGSSSSCAMPKCHGKVMRDERGEDILPCNCGFKICRDCYNKAVKTGRGICPGCKQPYDQTKSKVQMVSSFMIKPLSAQTSSQTDDVNLGNATDDETVSKMKPWRPLTQKIKPPVSILAPYWYIHTLQF
ncbi:Zinc finger, RING/FYVE/PHD-type [Corchorus capsularis]|uniref:Zinc finger, RING/FYVE/PHD-type n=1 Tax=Corchorus capsularis TaxID=210143 RepID=A0A1R3JC64_COCAP|nr:Zinc finger, RING/FYVE/PHD-type [Corchorus capsularis]